MPELFSTAWGDLPAEPATTQRSRQWRRGRTWRAAGADGIDLVFERRPAVPTTVGSRAHRALRDHAEGVGRVWGSVHDIARMWWDGGRLNLPADKRKDGRLHMWPTCETATMLSVVRAKLEDSNFVPGETAWLCREVAAQQACRVMRVFVTSERRPYLEPMRSPPAALTVRLACGGNHATVPVPGTGDSTGWLWLGELGWVRPALDGDASEACAWLASASYLEAAHVDRAWWLRGVRVTEVPGRARRQRRTGEAAERREEIE